MGRRFFNERGGDHVSFSEKWPGVGIGRFWKRQLSKARRRHIKAELDGRRGKEPTHYEGMVNYKTW